MFYWLFEFFIADLLLLWFHFVCTVSFCSYVILTSEKKSYHSKNCVWKKSSHIKVPREAFLKGDSNPKHFSFFVFYFRIKSKSIGFRKMHSTATSRKLNYFPCRCFLSFWPISVQCYISHGNQSHDLRCKSNGWILYMKCNTGLKWFNQKIFSKYVDEYKPEFRKIKKSIKQNKIYIYFNVGLHAFQRHSTTSYQPCPTHWYNNSINIINLFSHLQSAGTLTS